MVALASDLQIPAAGFFLQLRSFGERSRACVQLVSGPPVRTVFVGCYAEMSVARRGVEMKRVVLSHAVLG